MLLSRPLSAKIIFAFFRCIPTRLCLKCLQDLLILLFLLKSLWLTNSACNFTPSILMAERDTWLRSHTETGLNSLREATRTQRQRRDESPSTCNIFFDFVFGDSQNCTSLSASYLSSVFENRHEKTALLCFRQWILLRRQVLLISGVVDWTCDVGLCPKHLVLQVVDLEGPCMLVPFWCELRLRSRLISK